MENNLSLIILKDTEISLKVMLKMSYVIPMIYQQWAARFSQHDFLELPASDYDQISLVNCYKFILIAW